MNTHRFSDTPSKSLSGRIFTSGVLLLASTFIGCEAPCSKLCSNLADYAVECGFDISDEQIKSCKADVENKPGTCRKYGSPLSIRAELSCDEIGDYFQ